jgi:hypothetical protein
VVTTVPSAVAATPVLPPANAATPVPPPGNAKVADLESVIRRDLVLPVKRCYQKDLANNPDEAGKIVVALDIDSSGDVANASAASIEGLTPTVANCILGAAGGLHFSPGSGGRAFVPFTFFPTPVSNTGQRTPKGP